MARVEVSIDVNTVSRISEGTSIRGDIVSPYDIRIDGTFDGRLYSCGKVVIGETAEVSGEIVCTNVDLWGKMNGDFYVKDLLSLKSGCEVNGGLHVRKLHVEVDSSFNGTCRMITEEEFEEIAKNAAKFTEKAEK